MSGFLDDIAAGDEVRALQGQLQVVQEQLESMGARSASSIGGGKPLAHISVPREGDWVQLPAGKATVDFRQGTVRHEDLGTVEDDIVTISELMKEVDQQSLNLENLIFHSDTAARVTLDDGFDQQLNLDFVPLPAESFETVQVELQHPGQLLMLASTQRLPIGLGSLSIYASRYGELGVAQRDSPESVPVQPYALFAEEGDTYGDSTVWAAAYDTSTWTVKNTSGNGNNLVAILEAMEAPEGAGGEWHEISRDTIPDDQHSVFNVTERHHYLRCRFTNETNGQQVGGELHMTEASP